MGKENDMSVNTDNNVEQAKDIDGQTNDVQGQLEQYGFDRGKLEQIEQDLKSGDPRKEGNALNDLADDTANVIKSNVVKRLLNQKPGEGNETTPPQDSGKPEKPQDSGQTGKPQDSGKPEKPQDGDSSGDPLEDFLKLIAKQLGLDEQQTNQFIQMVKDKINGGDSGNTSGVTKPGAT
jgi:hypothetical protein